MLSPPGGGDAAAVAQKTKEIRERQNVPMSGAFLNALGLVAHQVLGDATDQDKADWTEDDWVKELRQRLAPFRHIDWSRQADIWDGNIVVGRDKIRTQAPAVKGAADKMLAVLDQAAQLNAA